MFQTESDNHGYINRATWLAALWYLDEIENMRSLSILNKDNPIMFDTIEEIMYYIENELDEWAAGTTVMDAHLEKAELYYLLHEVDANQILEQLKAKQKHTKEKEHND
jgi:hypothetical protein